jgi:hypothetical protein
MFIISPATVLNSSALETRQIPRRFFGRVTLIPTRGAGLGLTLRMIFEVELLRYLGALLPFVAAALVWRESALAIAQAPLIMFLVVYGVETRFLRLTPARRATLLEPGEAERGLDLLRVRALSILSRIATGRGLMSGQLHLVVEQSDLARIAPLTFVSVQSGDGPELLRLTTEEEALIRDTLFQPPLTERAFHRITLAEDEQVRDVVLDMRTISAHARLSAMMG